MVLLPRHEHVLIMGQQQYDLLIDRLFGLAPGRLARGRLLLLRYGCGLWSVRADL